MLSWRSYDVSGQGVVREARSEGLDFAHCVDIHSRLRLFSPDFCRTDKVIGCEPHPTFRFAERLNEMREPVWIRFVIVLGLTDDPGNIEEMVLSVAQEVRHEKNGSLCPGCLPWYRVGRHVLRRTAGSQ
jgi:hypothetical protein